MTYSSGLKPWAVRVYRAVLALIIVTCAGCADILEDMPEMPDPVGAEQIPVGAIAVSADEAFYSLEATEGTAKVVEGDFACITPSGEIYLEENNDGKGRICRVLTHSSAGADTIVYYQKPTRGDSDTAGSSGPRGKIFYRHFAVGYSYNALEGDYANPSDIRCQIINREMLRQYGKGDLLRYNRYSNVISHSSARYTSLSDYMHATTFSSEGGVGIQLFSAKVGATLTVFETDTVSSLIMTDKTSVLCAEYDLMYRDFSSTLRQHPEVLTASFRHAVNNLTDVRSVDRFIKMYGTHVVTRATLGASLEIEVQTDVNRFKDVYKQDFNIEGKLLGTLFHETFSQELSEAELRIVENSRCRLIALGGDPAKLGRALELNTFKDRGLSSDTINNWIASVKMDDDDIPGSNARLVDFEVKPIWFFIPDKQKADLVKARILGDAATMAEIYGNNNFVDAAINIEDLNPALSRGTNDNWLYFEDAPVHLAVAANRYVAMICIENIPEITEDPVMVTYPIYEGVPVFNDGICIHDGKRYTVAWLGQRFIVREEGPAATSMLWLNRGKLSTDKYDNITYETALTHPHIVFDFDLQPDGSIDCDGGNWYYVMKYLGDLYLLDPNGLSLNGPVSGVPGWEWNEKRPAAASHYGTEEEWQTLVPGMRFGSNCRIYYMPSLIRPVEQ